MRALARIGALGGTGGRGFQPRWVSAVTCSSAPPPQPFTGVPPPCLGSLALAVRTLASPRDPQRPKQPMAAFFRFLHERRQANTNKTRSDKEVVQEAGVEWNQMPSAKKAPYETAYRAERKDYELAMQQYRDSGKADLWKRDPKLPVKPRTGFFLFSAELREKHKDLKVTERATLAGQQWRAMSEQAKLPYEQRAAPDLEAYRTALKKYKESGAGEAWKAVKGPTKKDLAKAKEAAKKEKDKAKKLLAAQKLREKAVKQREKVKAAAKKEKEKEKEKVAKAKAKAKELEAAKKAKEKAARAKARLQLRSQKEKATLAQAKAKSRAIVAKAKAKLQKAVSGTARVK